MKTIEKSDATESLATYAGHAEDFPIVITDQGRKFMAENMEVLKNRLVENLSHLSEEDLMRLSKAIAEIKVVLPKIMHRDRSGQPH